MENQKQIKEVNYMTSNEPGSSRHKRDVLIIFALTQLAEKICEKKKKNK